MKALLVITLSLMSSILFSQTSFYKQFSGSGYDYAYGVEELPDSSYMITGSSSSFLEGPSQMFLLHVDSLGNFIWSHSYGLEGTDVGVRVKHIEGIGYFVGGYTNTTGAGAYDFAVWKIDETGEPIWFQTYGTSNWEKIHDMVVTPDSGLILVGETNNTDDGFTDIYLIRIDQDGNIIWENQIENDGNDNAYSIDKIDDDHYVICGTRFNSVTNLNQSWVSKIHIDGTEVWNNQWGSSEHYITKDVVLSLGKIYTTGYKTPNNMDSTYIVITIFDELTGNQLSETIENNIAQAAFHIANFEYPDAFAIGVSSGGEFSFGEEDNFLFAFNGAGVYYRTIGLIQYASSQVMNDLQTTYNRGMIAVGYNEHIGPGGSSIYIMRVGAFTPQLNSDDDFTTQPIVGIQSFTELENVTMYPNPSNNFVQIKGIKAEHQIERVTITNMVGQVIKEIPWPNSGTINLEEIPSGVYILTLENQQKNISYKQKLQIQHN